jgi:Tfp pilus assembly protein PilF
MKNWRLICGLFLLFASPIMATDETWVQVRSPNFLVISDGSEKQAREIAVGFEQIHNLFGLILPHWRTDSGAEAIVLAPRDQKTMKTLVPMFWEKRGAAHPGGLFRKGWEKDYAIIQLDEAAFDRSSLYHEYIHKIVGLNFTQIPLWLDEGLAEFLSNAQFEKSRTVIGAPSLLVGILQAQPPYPIKALLTAGGDSPLYNDEDKAGMFYAESWGLTHFLMLGKGMGNGARMGVYLELLQKGVDGPTAFQQTFGDPRQVQKQFNEYARHFTLPVLFLNKPVTADMTAFTSRRMSGAETAAMLGGFYTYFQEWGTAKQELTAALTEDPQCALAHENMAFLHFDQGEDKDAREEFDRALELNPNSYLALYYQTMLRWDGKNDEESLDGLDRVMQKVIQLNPRFAPALVVRSHIYAREGKLAQALQSALQAEKLEPDRGGYLTNVAAIDLLQHDYSNAIKIARTVATRWDGADSAEALSVEAQARRLGGIPATAEDQGQEADEMKYAENTTAVEGIVSSVSCDKSKSMELVLQSGDKKLVFYAGRDSGIGWSDTTWFGSDHFNACYHIEGMRAVVRFNPSSSQQEREFRWLEIRDDVIPNTPLAN